MHILIYLDGVDLLDIWENCAHKDNLNPIIDNKVDSFLSKFINPNGRGILNVAGVEKKLLLELQKASESISVPPPITLNMVNYS